VLRSIINSGDITFEADKKIFCGNPEIKGIFVKFCKSNYAPLISDCKGLAYDFSGLVVRHTTQHGTEITL